MDKDFVTELVELLETHAKKDYYVNPHFLDDVLRSLEDWYGVEVPLADEWANNCWERWISE